MTLIATYTQAAPGKETMSRAQPMGLILSDAKFMDQHDDIAAYVNTLEAGKALDAAAIRAGYEHFKAKKTAKELVRIAGQHDLDVANLQAFVGTTLQRMIFDGDALSDLLAPLDLGWKVRTKKELALMEELAPLLRKLAQNRDISGLSAYE